MNLFNLNCLSFRSVIFSFIVLAILLNSLEANAVPSFARQTGMKCVMCHTAFPQLTPFGRNFKMNGYTLSAEQATFPPLAVMFQGYLGFTYTRKPQATGALPSNYHNNNNVSVNQASIFYAGRLLGPYGKKLFGDSIGNILNKVGVFTQATRDGIAHTWSWDNVEFRVAQAMNIANKSVVVGAYANNNPTMQDLWNSTPTWGFPFSDSGLAPGPVASPLIAGGVSQQVVGLGVYMMIDNQLYLDVGSYKTLSQGKQKALGVEPAGETEIDGNAPYWRIALEKTWGTHTMEVGTYGLNANTFPGRDKSAGHDRFLDIAVDLQYQWSTTGKDVTISANWINEYQTLDASKLLGLAQNRSNKL